MPGRKSWICVLVFRSSEAIGNVRGLIIKSPLGLFGVASATFTLEASSEEGVMCIETVGR